MDRGAKIQSLVPALPGDIGDQSVLDITTSRRSLFRGDASENTIITPYGLTVRPYPSPDVSNE